MKLLSRLFKSLPPARGKRPDTLCQPDVPVQIIGDIHGQIADLTTLVEKLDATRLIVTVGDYIDRGDASAQVLAFLMDKTANHPDGWICLRGNHEDMMLAFLQDPERYGQRWLRHGGLQTLASFKVSGVSETSDSATLIRARDALRANMPDGLEDWLRELPLIWHSGNLWVVHAAADPKRGVHAQDPSTLVWGGGDFLTQPRQDGIWVAHGHTVVKTPGAQGGRIALDTGAYFSRVLTAACCDPSGDVTFISTSDT